MLLFSIAEKANYVTNAAIFERGHNALLEEMCILSCVQKQSAVFFVDIAGQRKG